jgi:hypothetical protein
MPGYRCLVSGSRGETACRIIQAPSEAEAIRQWERREERLISVEPVPEKPGTFGGFRRRKAVLEEAAEPMMNVNFVDPLTLSR